MEIDPWQNTRRRGELRLYLGAAPGVGKTFAMLGEAHRRVGRGTDVVIGFVETHGRAKTAELLDGLEVVAPKTLFHAGVEFTEMDVEAVLARQPAVAVVDAFAHTNVPGSRNVKRWQDIDELLDAGIDVLSTVNIDQVEAIRDVVERITGFRQRESVPDDVVRRAEQIELVDITPEALRRRLAHGNVYPAHKIDAALSNYFRPGNLTALRELALRWVADHVDSALQRYRTDQQITDTWEARERVVVAITGGPESEMLIRRARRIASRAGADLMVLHSLRGDRSIGTPPHTVRALRRLADNVGASFHTVVSDDIPDALLEFARGVNATQLVLGTTRRSRIARLFTNDIVGTVLQRPGPIDVHLVTHPEAAQRWPLRWPRLGLRQPRQRLGWVTALLGPVLVTVAGLPVRGDLQFSSVVMLQMLVIVLVAMLGGLVPGLAAVVISGGLLNFFFTQPYNTLVIANPQDVITLVVMLIIAVLVALVVDRAARGAQQAAQARAEANLLASYARTVLTHPIPVDRLVEKIKENFGLIAVTLLERHDDGWHRVASSGPDPCESPESADADLPVTADVHLALRGRILPVAERIILESAAKQALLALRHQRMAAQAAESQRQAEANELRTALLSAVGHDLRTPLTSIKAALGSLRAPDIALSTDDTEELLGMVEDATDRLTALVVNLLDSSRLATGTVRPDIHPVSYDEVVARALWGLEGQDDVGVDVDDRLPQVLADAGLLERVVANVIDNALRHGRPTNRDSTGGELGVVVHASAYAGEVELRVVDHGPGLPKGTVEQAFAPFQRLGDREAASGIGLGLSVAKGFLEAMGGRIHAEDTPGGGLTVVISLPAERIDQASDELTHRPVREV